MVLGSWLAATLNIGQIWEIRESISISVKMYKVIVTERRYNSKPLKGKKGPHHFLTKFGHSDHSEQQRCGPSLASRTTLSFRCCCPKYASLRVNLLDVDVGKLFHFRFSSFKARTNRKSGTNRKLLDAAAARLPGFAAVLFRWLVVKTFWTTSRFCPWRKKKVPGADKVCIYAFLLQAAA